MPVFYRNIPTTNDNETIWPLLQLQHTFVSQIVDTVKPFYGRYQLSRAGRDENLPAFYLFSTDLNDVFSAEVTLSFVEIHILMLRYSFPDMRLICGSAFSHPTHDGTEVDMPYFHRNSQFSGFLYLYYSIGGVYQHFRWDTAQIETGAAQRPLIHHSHFQPMLNRLIRNGRPTT